MPTSLLNSCFVKQTMLACLGGASLSLAADTIYYGSTALDSTNSVSIYTMDLKGKDVKLLRPYQVRGRGEEAIDVNNNGNKVAYGTYQFGGWKLAIADLSEDGRSISNIKKLTKTNTYKYYPRFSPDGDFIAYRNYYTQRPPRFQNGNNEIFVIDLNSGEDINLSQNPGPDAYPFWAWDQEHILYSSDRVMNGRLDFDLYTADIKTGLSKPLIETANASEFGASYSHDGQSMAYLSIEDGKLHLYKAKSDGTHRVNLTKGKVVDATLKSDINMHHYGFNTVWSADDNHIVFVSHWEQDREVYRYDLRQKQLTNLTNNEHDELYVNIK